MRRSIALAVAALTALSATGTKAAPSIPAETGRFYNILPPGQHGSTNALEAAQYFGSAQRPAHFDDQLGMYANLVYNTPGLSDADITTYFKEAGFTVAPSDVTRTEVPRIGLTIVRDRFDVPHIYGDTAYDVEWGTGWATGQDRLFVADVLRHVGRGRLSEFLGASDANLALDRSVVRVAGYTEEELQLQFDLMASKFGTFGVITQEAIKAFIDGINAWIVSATATGRLPAEYPALQVAPVPWKVTDVVAVATLIQAVFAGGGGGELRNVELLQALGAETLDDYLNPPALYRDLLNREEPEAPVTTERSFPYQAPERIDRRSVAIPDAGSFVGIDPVSTLKEDLRRAGIPFPAQMSNWLAVTAENTADGHPIAVMGPQTGYFSPNLLMEIDIHGGGIDARGMTFAGVSMFVLIGRGIDFAWSATSGGSDIIDIRVEKLCNPDGSRPVDPGAMNYLLHGICTPMYERTDRFLAKPSAGGIAEPEVITNHIVRTSHGPVIGRATVGGEPVAIAYQRSTFFGEIDSAPPFAGMNANVVRDPESFFDAMAGETGTFNWLYVDADHVAYYHSGLYPRRARGVPNELPTWGTGEWEWQGFLGRDERPHDTDPRPGFIASWNNKPARDWRASDANYSYGTVYRVQSLTERLRRAVSSGGITVAQMIDIMMDAGTVDLRGSQDVPYALDILGADADVAPYTRLLRDWVEHGAHRRAPSAAEPYDRQAAVALMDAWYEPMIHAVFDGDLDGLYGKIPLGFDDHNRVDHVGSAFQDGYYGWLQKAFKQALGRPVAAPFTELSCADGTLDGCRAALKQSLLDAVGDLTKRQGGGPDTWKVDKAVDAIVFSAVGVVAVPNIDWQNRPTYQQAVQVTSHRG